MSATATMTATVAIPTHSTPASIHAQVPAPTPASTSTSTSMSTSTSSPTAAPSTPKMPSTPIPHEPITPLPRRPDPSTDPFLATPLKSPKPFGLGVDDLFSLEPVDAMQLLCAGIENLVAITGDVPPTPPLKNAQLPNMLRMQEEKESLVRSHSEKNLSRLRIQDDGSDCQTGPSRASTTISTAPITAAATTNDPSGGGAAVSEAGPTEALKTADLPRPSFGSNPSGEGIDGVRLRSPTSPNHPIEPYTVIIGEDEQPLNLQHSALTRKFYCKKAPNIAISDYLTRMHRFCPMSTAVYLAASLYIHRLAVEERAIPVTRRNAHRLLLASLRVAMKMHDDRLFSHVAMARVGGVTTGELARLEISFCFLTSFDLAVTAETLRRHWVALRRMRDTKIGGQAEDLPPLRIKRKEKAPA